MGIKCEVTPPVPSKATFPKLMHDKTTGLVVLFSSDESGVVVRPSLRGSEHRIGFKSDEWFMANFSDFHGSVTLENE